jgi:hypothetical protein
MRKFGIRIWLLIAGAIAIYSVSVFFLGYMRPVLFGTGILICLKCYWKQRGGHSFLTFMAAISGAILVWMALVEKYERVTECEKCHEVRQEIGYSVFGCSVFRTMELKAGDAAIPEHEHTRCLVHEYSYWGLVFPVGGSRVSRGIRRISFRESESVVSVKLRT